MNVPGSFRKYDVVQGEKGLARIELADIGGKTAIRKLRTKSPILVQKALHLDTDNPGMAHVYLMSSAGGILQGDTMKIDIIAGTGTFSRITTQAATKIYKMDKGYAAQKISISAQDKSYTEIIPYQLIPFKSSRFFQQVDIELAQTSTVIYSETVSAGRTASGENFEFDVCFLKLTARRSSGRLLFVDHAKIEPDKGDVALLFGSKTLWSTCYLVTPRLEDIHKLVDAAIKESSILAGHSILPNDCGLMVRMLDDSIDRVRDLTEVIAGIARKHAFSLSKATT